MMICKKCRKPIIPGVDARYTIADSDDGKEGIHWDCYDEEKREFEEGMKKLPELIARAEMLIKKIRH